MVLAMNCINKSEFIRIGLMDIETYSFEINKKLVIPIEEKAEADSKRYKCFIHLISGMVYVFLLDKDNGANLKTLLNDLFIDRYGKLGSSATEYPIEFTSVKRSISNL